MVAWLGPKQSVVVTVETFVVRAAEDGFKNTITFTAWGGAERIMKSAIMNVVHTRRTDYEEPRVWQKYTSDCTNVIWGKCEDATWAIEVTAQDTKSGKINLATFKCQLPFGNILDFRVTAVNFKPQGDVLSEQLHSWDNRTCHRILQWVLL